MTSEKGHAYRLLTESNPLVEGPLRLIRTILLVSTDGGDVTLYEGTGTTGRKITKLTGLANNPQSVELDIYCANGVYYDEGSNVTSCLIVFDPVV